MQILKRPRSSAPSSSTPPRCAIVAPDGKPRTVIAMVGDAITEAGIVAQPKVRPQAAAAAA